MLVTLSILSSIQDGIMAFLLALDGIVYKVVGWLYQVFIAISSARIFSNETFEVFEQRIYIILGIAMLFVLAYSLLQSIANPDEMNKGSFSAGKIVINTVTSLVLIAIMPTLFDFAYEAQRILMNQNIVGKIILGSYSSTSPKINVTYDDQAACDTLGQSSTPCTVSFSGTAENELELAGNSIAVDIFSSFYYPNPAGSVQTDNSINLYEITYNDLKNADTDFTEKAQEVYKNISNYNQCGAEGESAYIYGEAAEKCALASGATNTSNYDERNILYRSILQYAKTTGDFSGFSLTHKLIGEDIMEYTFIISTIAGGFCCYILASYCLDMGLRAAKLGFAQLIAPIPILARIIPKQSSMFDSWLKFTTSTFIQVFIKIAILFFGIFMVTNIPDTWDMISSSSLFTLSLMSFKTPVILDLNASYGVVAFARVVVIIGILMFMKQATNLVTEALGINVNAGSLNIRNKLRGMAGGDKMLSGASKVAGATTGAVGAGFLAKRKGAKFWPAALQGGRSGMRAGGWQYQNQRQNVYNALGGSGKVGLFGTGPSIGTKINNKIDEANKANNTYYDNLNKLTVKNFEEKILNPIVDDLYKKIKNKQKEMENSPEFRNLYQSKYADMYGKYMAGEAKDIAARKAAYESSSEYAAIRSQVRGQALRDVRAEAARNGESINDMEVHRRANEKTQERMLDAIKAYNSDAARQYLNDINREKTAMDELTQKAREAAATDFAKENSEYKKALETTKENIKKEQIDAMKKDRKEFEKEFAQYMAIDREQLSKDLEKAGFDKNSIKSQIDNLNAKDYLRASGELDNKGKLSNDKKLEDAWKAINDKYNKK